MRKESSLPIRLDSDVNRRLEVATKRLGFTKSALIRMLIQSFVDQLDANGGKITLPMQWNDTPDISAKHASRANESPHLKSNAKST